MPMALAAMHKLTRQVPIKIGPSYAVDVEAQSGQTFLIADKETLRTAHHIVMGPLS